MRAEQNAGRMKYLSYPLRSLTLRQRLALVALLCALLCLLPTAQLGLRLWAELDAVAAERAGLPANRAWQQLLAGLNAHRQAAAALAAHPEAETERLRAQQASEAALAALQAGPAAQREAVAALRRDFEALAGAVQRREVDLAALLQGQRALAERAFETSEQLNAAAGLLSDPEAGAQFALVAGLQSAPRIGDALSELSAIAAAAAIDDIGRVATAATRFHLASQQLQQQLALAAQLDPARADAHRDARETAARQQAMVAETLEASARDLNFPLDQMSAAFAGAAALQQQLSARVLDALELRLAERDARLRRAAALTLAAVLAGLGLVGLLLWRSIVGTLRPVLQTIEATERIAAGDLSGRVAAARPDEMGRVLQAVAGMQARLRGLVGRLQTASGEIHQAADEIAAGNLDLSRRSEASAARMQQAAGSVEQLSRTVAGTAEAADVASRLAREAAAAAQRGSAEVGEFLATMGAISAGSQRIADITGVIDGIAFQTNILALNAAVEAARAGAQGRGFAVVAGEVRALAQRAAAAAREIKGLIGEAATRVESGSRQIGAASSALGGIAEGVARVDAMIGRIATDARHEAARMHELSQAIAQIDRMTQQNAALVEQSAAAAQSMNQQAEQMSALAGEFRLG
jgi:methyl-accepting chemotaxis protein